MLDLFYLACCHRRVFLIERGRRGNLTAYLYVSQMYLTAVFFSVYSIDKFILFRNRFRRDEYVLFGIIFYFQIRGWVVNCGIEPGLKSALFIISYAERVGVTLDDIKPGIQGGAEERR